MIGILINFLVPILGLLYYFYLKKSLERKEIRPIPQIQIGILFFTYGGLLILVLTEFFWKWSGLASLGAFYLIILAPIILSIQIINLFRLKNKNKVQKRVLVFSALYFGIAPAIFYFSLLNSKN